MSLPPPSLDELRSALGGADLQHEEARDGIPTFWVDRTRILDTLGRLKNGIEQPYNVLFDLTALDERERQHRQGMPPSDFTMVYHLLSMQRNQLVRAKVALRQDDLQVPTVTPLWKSANWYEREVWDMFGIRAEGHPNLTRILMPGTWVGHPLRKDHPARATDMGVFTLTDEKQEREQQQLRFSPEAWGMDRGREGADYLFLNIGPQHPGTHGVLRVVLQLDGEEILDAVPDIGYHHRGKEKMAERQSWHTYIPYTDRVDYLSGVANNLSYLTAVEKLGGIEVPPRALFIRVMLTELFRIINHLVWYGTFAQDLGQMSPVFYMFNDREVALSIIESVCGARMHPNWFRIGGVAQDLPRGWQDLVRGFLHMMPARLREYDREVMQNRIFRARTRGVGVLTAEEAIDWGVTGPNLRACGVDWDLRKKRPYSGYEQFEFEVPTATEGDCYARAVVRVEEIRQSLRIIEQCLERMPDGPHQSAQGRATPPRKQQTMHDIETLIHHFVHVSWGPVLPPGEAIGLTEGSKGSYGYYLVSDGSPWSYRTRIRSPSFPHMQALPLMARGLTVADLLAILGSMDYVLADVDR